MACIVCVLHEPFTLHCTGLAGHVRGHFLGKDDSYDSTLSIHFNYLSMHSEHLPSEEEICVILDHGQLSEVDVNQGQVAKTKVLN